MKKLIQVILFLLPTTHLMGQPYTYFDRFPERNCDTSGLYDSKTRASSSAIAGFILPMVVWLLCLNWMSTRLGIQPVWISFCEVPVMIGTFKIWQ